VSDQGPCREGQERGDRWEIYSILGQVRVLCLGASHLENDVLRYLGSHLPPPVGGATLGQDQGKGTWRVEQRK